MSQSKGFIALTSVLIIFGISLIVGVSVSLLAISEATMGLKKSQSSQAYYLANLCAEQALMRLKANSSYAGFETINEAGGSCQIQPIAGNRTINVSGSFQNTVKKNKIVVSQIAPQMIISSWQEVGDF